MGKTMKTPQRVQQESYKPVKYDVEDGSFVQVKDDLFDDGSEDREIMASIKSAEAQLGQQMKTPKKV